MIDPFFENPHTFIDPDDVATPEYLLCTHAHADHIADAGAFTDATLVATPELTSYLVDEHGFEDTIPAGGMNLGSTVDCGDADVPIHRVDHTNGMQTSYEYSAGPPTGFVIADTLPTQVADEESQTFYHAGDTGLMTEMREVIGPYLEPDAAALPVGDRFTMGPMQAAIAADWLNVEHVMPMHYDTFGPIEIDVGQFEREVRAVGSAATVHVLDGDETFTIE